MPTCNNEEVIDPPTMTPTYIYRRGKQISRCLVVNVAAGRRVGISPANANVYLNYSDWRLLSILFFTSTIYSTSRKYSLVFLFVYPYKCATIPECGKFYFFFPILPLHTRHEYVCEVLALSSLSVCFGAFVFLSVIPIWVKGGLILPLLRLPLSKASESKDLMKTV